MRVLMLSCRRTYFAESHWTRFVETDKKFSLELLADCPQSGWGTYAIDSGGNHPSLVIVSPVYLNRFLSVIDGISVRLFIVMTEIPGLTPSASNRNCNAQPARQAHCFNALQCFSDGLCKGLSKPRKTSSGTAKEYRPSILMWSKISGDNRATSSLWIG